MKGEAIRVECIPHPNRSHTGELHISRSPNGAPCMCFFNALTDFKSIEDIEKKELIALDTELARTLFL